jgi:hypothetical protein
MFISRHMPTTSAFAVGTPAASARPHPSSGCKCFALPTRQREQHGHRCRLRAPTAAKGTSSAAAIAAIFCVDSLRAMRVQVCLFNCCGAPDKKHGASRHVLELGENDDFAPGCASTMAALHPQMPAAQLRCSQCRVATAAPAITAGIIPELRSGVCACCAFCGFFGITVVLRSSCRRRRCSENFRVTFTATLFPGYKHHVVVPSRPDSYIHYMCFKLAIQARRERSIWAHIKKEGN